MHWSRRGIELCSADVPEGLKGLCVCGVESLCFDGRGVQFRDIIAGWTRWHGFPQSSALLIQDAARLSLAEAVQ